MATLIDLLAENLETKGFLHELGQNHIIGNLVEKDISVDFTIDINGDVCEIYVTSPQLLNEHIKRLNDCNKDGFVISDSGLSITKILYLIEPKEALMKLIIGYFTFMVLEIIYIISEKQKGE